MEGEKEPQRHKDRAQVLAAAAIGPSRSWARPRKDEKTTAIFWVVSRLVLPLRLVTDLSQLSHDERETGRRDGEGK
jgi:hypothetical protein